LKKLTATERKLVEQHPGVLKTTTSHIVFSPEFKLRCMDLYEKGLSAKGIFIDQGFNYTFLYETFFEDNLKRWRKLYKAKGKNAFFKENRGRSKNLGRPPKLSIDDLSNEELKHFILVQAEVINQLKKKKALAKKN
jgi:hypothetical protein